MNNLPIFRFFKEERTSVLLFNIGFTVLITGISSIVLLAIINEVAFNGRRHPSDFSYFCAATLVFAFGTRYMNIRVTRVVEGVLADIRLRVMQLIRNTELTEIEQIGKSDVHIALSQDVVLVSDSADMLIAAVQQSAMLCFCLIYVAWLSPAAFGVVFGTILITYFLLGRLAGILSDNYANLSKEEGRLFSKIDHLIHGFKETRINKEKSDSLYQSYQEHVSETKRLKIDNRIHASWTILASHLFLYMLLGGIIFGLPLLIDSTGGLIGKLVATMLFILTPLLLIQEGIPTIERANSALRRIYRLEKHFMERANAGKTLTTELLPPEFSTLRLDNTLYRYPPVDGATQFTVGPVNLQINKGEIVFITGGNGSGKSTLLKILCGLYPASSGKIFVNSEVIANESLERLREQFTIVFVDFHLFDEFYGVREIDSEKVNHLINKMNLTGKVTYLDGRFSTTNLSTGQRKRLALIMALLDERSIFIFDEWAADQDVHFRDYYYSVILPELSRQGKTVIAVTHDDRYWSYCDRLFKVDLGSVFECSTTNSHVGTQKIKEKHSNLAGQLF